MRLIDLDEFLRQNCVDRIEGKSCEECKHHVLEVSCERLMEQPTAERAGKWIKHKDRTCWYCSECTTDDYYAYTWDYDTNKYKFQDNYCPNCGARMAEGEEDE